MGAYAEALPIFGEHGIQVYPTLPRRPTVAMVKPAAKFRAQTVDLRFANANAAMLAGAANGITVVDIDAPGDYHRDMAEEIFGPTPYVVETPSGGHHLGYRHGGERRSIRPFGKDIPIDVLGGGTVVAPPSIRPANGKKCAGKYRFNGDLSCALAALPTVREGLPLELYKANNATMSSAPTTTPTIGQRNDALFKRALSLAANRTDPSDLVEVLLRENERLAEPLPVDEVQRIADSAWRYKMAGSLCVPGSRMGFLELQEITALSTNTSALTLLAYLRAHHPADHIFAISPRGIAKSGALKMDAKTIRAARQFLIENRLLEMVEAAGWVSGKQQPAQFRLPINGGENFPTIELTPPPVDRDRG